MGASNGKVQVWNRALDRIGETKGITSETERRPAVEICARHWDDIVKEVLEAKHWPWAMRQAKITNINEQTSDFEGDDALTKLDIPYAFIGTEQVTVEKSVAGGEYADLVEETDYTVTVPETDGSGTLGFVTLVSALATGDAARVTVTNERMGWEQIYSLPADCVTPLGLQPEDTRYATTAVEDRIEFILMANDAGDGSVLCTNADETDFDKLEYVALIDNVKAWSRKFLDIVIWKLAAELAAGIKKDTKLADYCLNKATESLVEATAQSQGIGYQGTPESPSLSARR